MICSVKEVMAGEEAQGRPEEVGGMVEARALVERGALFVASHSGGKDSQAMLIRLLAMVPSEQILVVHASLGDVEWPGAEEHARRQAEIAGLPFLVARAGKTFFEMVEHRFKVRPGPNSSCWPSASNRQCTSDLKRDPIAREVRRYAKSIAATRIVSCMGMRAAESPRRSKMPAWAVNVRGSVAGREWYDWLPIHHLSTAEVFETIRAAGQEPHPAYAAGNQRLSCVFCILGSATDARNGAIHHPDLFERYVQLERRTGYTAHQSRRSLEEVAGITVEQARQEHRERSERFFLEALSRRPEPVSVPAHFRQGDTFEIPHMCRRDGSTCGKVTSYVVGSGPVPQHCTHCGERFDEGEAWPA